MSNQSSVNNYLDVGYAEGYLQMILGKKRKALKAKRKQERKNRKKGRK